MSSNRQGRTWVGPTIDPAVALANAKRIAGDLVCGKDDLARLSPVPIDPTPYKTTIDFLTHLYRNDEGVNLVYKHVVEDGKASPYGCGKTFSPCRLIEAIAKYKTTPFCDGGTHVRLNPMDGQGVSDKNVMAFRYALLEWDYIPVELQMSLVARLPLPIVSVITSGHKSIHAWVLIDAPDLETYKSRTKELFSLLAPTGIDHHNRNPSRLGRMPGTHRLIPNPDGFQRLLYLNPNPKSKSIL